jgi:hypothetical protein
VKSCPKSPFHKDSKEYEELLESVNAPLMENKKKSYIPQGQLHYVTMYAIALNNFSALNTK